MTPEQIALKARIEEEARRAAEAGLPVDVDLPDPLEGAHDLPGALDGGLPDPIDGSQAAASPTTRVPPGDVAALGSPDAPAVAAPEVLGANKRSPELMAPLEIPERHVRRPGSKAGRTAHKIFGALLSPITGGDTYQRRMAREEAIGERDYQDALRKYGLQKQQRDEQLKEARRSEPLSPEMLQALRGYGIELPDGSTREDAELARNFGLSGITRARESDAAAAGLQSQRLDAQKDLAGQQHDFRMEEIGLRNDAMLEAARLRAKRRGKGGKGGGHSARSGVAKVAQVAGISEEEAREGLQDITDGQFGTDAALKIAAATDNKDVDRIVKNARAFGAKAFSDSEGAEKDITKFFNENADVRRGMASWSDFQKKNAGNISEWIDELRTVGYTGSSDGAKSMVRAMRGPVAAFLRKMAGAAMSPAEAGLHGGPMATLLVEGQGGGWTSVDGLASKFESWLSRSNSRPEDLFATMDRIGGEVDEKMKAVTRAAPTAALNAVPEAERRPILMDRLRSASQDGKLNVPAGGKILPSTIRLDGQRIRYTVVMPDGSKQEGQFR